MHRTTDVDRLATAASNYAEAYGAADAIARVALIEAEDGRLSADRIAEYRALLDETKGGVA